MRVPMIALLFCVAMCSSLSQEAQASSDTIKVFLMAGQSNMQGRGDFEKQEEGVELNGTLRDYVNKNPAKYGHLVDGAGNFVTRDDVWVWSQQGSSGGLGGTLTNTEVRTGFLTTGFGATDKFFGPELGFGNVIGDAYDEQVVLVKTAWGGASLHETFLSPTAVARRNAATGGSETTGQAYTAMITAYQQSLVDIAAQFPDKEIELVGMAWHQGWNDSLNVKTITDDADQPYNQYDENLADLINDVRSDLDAADLPFVLATTGMATANARGLTLQQSQLKLIDETLYPDFAGNVGAVDTNPFLRDANISPGPGQSYHWYKNGESYYLVGEGLGEEMLQVVPEPSSLGLLGLGSLYMLHRRR